MLDRVVKVGALFFAVVFFLVGALGVYLGVNSVRAGGYADDIFLGAFIMLAYPLPFLFLYFYIRGSGKGRG